MFLCLENLKAANIEIFSLDDAVYALDKLVEVAEQISEESNKRKMHISKMMGNTDVEDLQGLF